MGAKVIFNSLHNAYRPKPAKLCLIIQLICNKLLKQNTAGPSRVRRCCFHYLHPIKTGKALHLDVKQCQRFVLLQVFCQPYGDFVGNLANDLLGRLVNHSDNGLTKIVIHLELQIPLNRLNKIVQLRPRRVQLLPLGFVAVLQLLCLAGRLGCLLGYSARPV
jgi:hypothetical protein